MACTVVAGARPHLREHGDDARHLDLEPGLRAPGLARHFVSEMAGQALAPESLAVARLLVSELVTNAVLHGRTAICLGVSRSTRHVLVTVQDANDVGPPDPPMPPAENLLESGRGMALVRALSSDSGWSPLPDQAGKVVWFTLAVGAGVATALT